MKGEEKIVKAEEKIETREDPDPSQKAEEKIVTREDAKQDEVIPDPSQQKKDN